MTQDWESFSLQARVFLQILLATTLSLDRIEAVKSAMLPERKAQALTPLARPIQGIRFEQIHFSYTQDSPYIRDVDLTALQALAGRFVSRFYEPGQGIYAQGDAGDKFYIVVHGTVSISTLDAGHQVIRLADLQDGDYFGEVEMVNKGRRTTTVKAHTPSLVLALDAEHFHGMVDELGALSKVVTQMALGRSLSTICSVGRRRRSHPVWLELSRHK